MHYSRLLFQSVGMCVVLQINLKKNELSGFSTNILKEHHDQNVQSSRVLSDRSWFGSVLDSPLALNVPVLLILF